MSTARTIRRFTDEPVDDATLARCLQAATWAPSGANAQAWRFVVLRSPEQRAVVAEAAAQALGSSSPLRDVPPRRRRRQPPRPHQPSHLRAPRPGRRAHVGAVHPAALRLGVRAAARRLDLPRDAELPPGRPRPGPRCLPTSWASYGGEPLLRDAVGVPDDWMLAGHVVVGWPRGRHGPVRRRHPVAMSTSTAGPRRRASSTCSTTKRKQGQ